LDDTSKLIHPVPAADEHEYNARIIPQELAGCQYRVEFMGAAEIVTRPQEVTPA
jgi:hypothetical protein